MWLSCSVKDPNKVSLATLNWERPNSYMLYIDMIGNQVIFMNPQSENPNWLKIDFSRKQTDDFATEKHA